AMTPYLSLKDALVASDDAQALIQARAMVTSWNALSVMPQAEDEHEHWSTLKQAVSRGASATVSATDLESRRAAFETLSDALITVLDRYGVTGTTLYKQF